MSYYNQQQQPPIGVPPPQGYISQGEAKDAYPPPGYLPQQAYPTLAQSYPPQQQYAQPPPNQQSGGGAAKGCLEGCCARGSPKRQMLYEKVGHFQVPYLEDPNTGVQMFESAEIIDYLRATYAL